jgi:hypothetical protein
VGGGEPGEEGGGGLEHGLPGQERGRHSQGNRHMEVSGRPPCGIVQILTNFMFATLVVTVSPKSTQIYAEARFR